MNLGSPAGFSDLTNLLVDQALCLPNGKNGLEGPGTRTGKNSHEGDGEVGLREPWWSEAQW